MTPELPLVNLEYNYISFNDNKKYDFEYYFNQAKNYWIFNNKSNIRTNVSYIQSQIQNIINNLKINVNNFYEINFFILITNHSFNNFSFVILTEEIMYSENTKYGKYEYNLN
jgi:hypothetical protein